MSERTPGGPSESIYTPPSSAAPAYTAAGLALAIAGIYGKGLVLPNWCWSVLGALFLVLSLRHWLNNSRRDLAKLPKDQPANPNLR